MSISVNIRSWFACKLCPAALFSTVVDFVEHKMKTHFAEFEAQNVIAECFVFEERTPLETANGYCGASFSENSSLVEDEDPLNTEGNPDPEIAASTVIKTEAEIDPLNLNDFIELIESPPLISAQDLKPLTQESAITDSVRFSFQCQLCTKEFNSEPELQIHAGICSLYNTQHQNRFRIPSKKLFSTRAHYNGHNLKCRTAEEEKSKFGICRNDFGTASVSKLPTESHKENGKQGEYVLCEEGGISSSTKHVKTQHSKVHSEMRSFECPTCSKSFKTQHALGVHEVKHSDERPFNCPVPNCGKTYKRKSSLSVHIGVHLDERRFHCPVFNCGKKFRIKTQLSRHLVKTHPQDPLQ